MYNATRLRLSLILASRSIQSCRQLSQSASNAAGTTRHVTPASGLGEKYETQYDGQFKDLFGSQKNMIKPEDRKFSHFTALRPDLQIRLHELGYVTPMPVQYEALQATLEGRDVVIKSMTGSGKTLAYVLPLLNKIGAQRHAIGGKRPQAILTAPTRQLCRQISNVLESFIGTDRLIRMWAGGGAKVKEQAKIAQKEGRDIVVATPGRVMQFVTMNIIRPEDLLFLVLDEADELLHEIFYRNIRMILDHSNKSKQIMMTTATVPPNVQYVMDRYMHHHAFIDLSDQQVSLPDQVRHKAVLVEDGVFPKALQWVLKNEHRECTMVFVKYLKDCSSTAEMIRSWGYSCKHVNSELSDNQCEIVMEDFMSGEMEVLVCTDMVARGVDVPECSLVVHLRPDQDTTRYVHRAGRTGRAGRSGTSYLMVMNENRHDMKFLSELTQVASFEYFLFARNQICKLVPKEEKSEQ